MNFFCKNKILFNFNIIILYFTLTLSLFANDNVYFIDLNKIIQETEKGKLIVKEINKLNDTNISLISTKEEELKLKESSIISSKNIISNEEFNSKISALKKEINQLMTERNKLINEFEEKKRENLENFFSIANPTIQKYMKDNEISILIDKKNIYIGNSNYDITNEIIKIMNNN